MTRLKEILKDKGKTMKDLANSIGIERESLYSRLKNPKLDTLQAVSRCLGCEIHELFETSKEYAHFYDKGEYLGIRKKKL